MQVFHFHPGRPPVLAGAESDVETSGFYWLDFERSETDWHDRAQRWTGKWLHDRHIQDALNETHPPFYDGTDDYDLLVFRSPSPDRPVEAPSTRPVAFIILPNAIVTVRPPGDPVFSRLHQNFLSAQRKSPAGTGMLLYLLLDQIIDRLLALRNPTSDLLARWQDRLLDQSDGFQDWQALMSLRGWLRRLDVVAESQADALEEWRDQTRMTIDQPLAVRFNDLREHLGRVYNYAVVAQADIDGLVQIYFSYNTQRTNDTLQFLTVVSAIFLPLNLLAGIFGMNFIALPWLQSWYGPWLVAGLMLGSVTTMLVLFRRRRWI